MVLSKMRRLLILQTGCFDEVDFQGCHISQATGKSAYESIAEEHQLWLSLLVLTHALEMASVWQSFPLSSTC